MANNSLQFESGDQKKKLLKEKITNITNKIVEKMDDDTVLLWFGNEKTLERTLRHDLIPNLSSKN